MNRELNKCVIRAFIYRDKHEDKDGFLITKDGSDGPIMWADTFEQAKFKFEEALKYWQILVNLEEVKHHKPITIITGIYYEDRKL